MDIPLAFFLLAYVIFVGFFLVFTLFNIFHIVKFGVKSVGAYVVTFSYVALSLAVLIVSYIYIAQIDWNQTVTLFSSSSPYQLE